jgi:hypothetical protein
VNKLSPLVAAALLTLPRLASAEDPQPPTSPADATKPAAEPAKPPPWYSTITLAGTVDGYYQLRVDAAQDAPLVGRVFDNAAGFNLGYAKLSVAMAPAPAGFRLDVGYGPAADVISGATSSLKYVQQAYVAMLLGPIEVDLGRFVTSAGAEVIEAKDNWIYSRSLLFGLIPFTHVGVRASVPVVPNLVLTLGVNNGWDVLTGGQPAKTGQVSLAYSGPSSSTAAVNVYTGINPTTFSGAPNTTFWRTLVDVVLGASFGPLDLNLNGDWSTEAADTWYGGALMARYHLPGDVARISARGEVVKDKHGVRFATGTDTTVTEGTLSVAIPVGGSSEVRVEGRFDHASENVFAKSSTSPNDNQVTATLAALAWF